MEDPGSQPSDFPLSAVHCPLLGGVARFLSVCGAMISRERGWEEAAELPGTRHFILDMVRPCFEAHDAFASGCMSRMYGMSKM